MVPLKMVRDTLAVLTARGFPAKTFEMPGTRIRMPSARRKYRGRWEFLRRESLAQIRSSIVPVQVALSLRSAVIGNTLAARRAGISDATIEEIASRPVAPASVIGSYGLTW